MQKKLEESIAVPKVGDAENHQPRGWEIPPLDRDLYAKYTEANISNRNGTQMCLESKVPSPARPALRCRAPSSGQIRHTSCDTFYRVIGFDLDECDVGKMLNLA